MGIVIGEIAGVAENLAIACLSHGELARVVLEGESKTGFVEGKPEILGERLGQFYCGIYKAVAEAGKPLKD